MPSQAGPAASARATGPDRENKNVRSICQTRLGAARPYTGAMCGRFTLTRQDREELARELGVSPEDFGEAEYRPRYNVAPLQRHWIVRLEQEDRRLLPARWGLVNSWAKDNKRAAQQINARAETIDARPAFRAAFKARRCVVPADGFYEWTGPKGNRRPLWFHRPDGGLLLFAGLYEAWFPEKDTPETTFTIVTTQANDLMAPVHDRMPVILSEEAADEGMLPGAAVADQLLRLLGPPPNDWLIPRPASTRMNSVKVDAPDVLRPDE